MAYKLLAVDVDGTLLDSGSKLTEATKTAIRSAIDKGVIFVISTGRPIQGVHSLMKGLELDSDLPVITYNGAVAIKYKSLQVLYRQNLSVEDAKAVIELGDKLGTTVMAWSDNSLYATRLNDRATEYSKISGVEPVLITDPEGLAARGVTKVLWYDDVEVVDRYQREIGGSLGENINYHTSRPYFLEFVDKRASKAIAMEKIGLHYGITSEEMIAIGDGLNDLSMIEYAGLGVAMGNAADEVKHIAGYITLTNDEDGVAHAINRFITHNDR